MALFCQERLIAERDELFHKRERLIDFIRSDAFTTVSEYEQGLLQEQKDVMKRYILVLDRRVALFPVADEDLAS